MDKQTLKDYLDFKASIYEDPTFITNDPILFPHRFSRKEDIEIAAFLMAIIAWGNRKAILQSGEKLHRLMGQSPFDFVMNYDGIKRDFVHRTFNGADLDFFLRGLKDLYHQQGLEQAFSSDGSMQLRIHNFRKRFLQTPHEVRSEKHLSDPLKGSAAKRINLFLRWMVRSPTKGVDFGIWKRIQPAELYLPLDVHTGTVARQLGLTSNKQDNWKTLEEIMECLRDLDPLDPVKYDFALFGIGVTKELQLQQI